MPNTELDNPEKMITVLNERNFEIIAMTITQSGSFSVVRIIVNNVLWASSALWEAGFTVNMSDILNEAKIRVKYMYIANCRSYYEVHG